MVTVLALLLGSSALSIVGAVPWYQRGPFYQIFPLSYADSDGDGKGDLRGIAEHADYLENLGIEAIWLNSICKSPFEDSGYDCSDFVTVNPDMGTIEDFEYMINVLHAKGIKVMIDFVPNHSSNQHQWFLDSAKRLNGKDDYYVWMDANGTDSSGAPIAPYSAGKWTYNEDRKQFYFHQFANFQPDLNYSNPKVLEEMKEVMRFWLRKGVDGFRVDAAMSLWENGYDDPENEGGPGGGGGPGGAGGPGVTGGPEGTGGPGGTGEPGGPDGDGVTGGPGGAGGPSGDGGEGGGDSQQRGGPPSSAMTCQPESVKIMKEFNAILEEDEFKNVTRANIIEIVGGLNCSMSFFDGKNAPINLELTGMFLTSVNKSAGYVKAINDWMTSMPASGWPNWEFGNHDNSRTATRLGADMVDASNMINLLLPGLPMTYYGEELGMSDAPSNSTGAGGPGARGEGPLNGREAYRNPMQWSSSPNAGFTSAAKAYIDITPNYVTVNAESESKLARSHLNVYKQLVALHKELVDSGTKSFKTYTLSEHVFAFQRPSHLVLINVNDVEETINLKNVQNLPKTLTVKISSAGYAVGDTVSKSSVAIARKSGLVLSFESTTPSFASKSRHNFLFVVSFCILAVSFGRNLL